MESTHPAFYGRRRFRGAGADRSSQPGSRHHGPRHAGNGWFQNDPPAKTQSAITRSIIIVVTALGPDDIEAEGGLPAGIPVYPKPIPFAALRVLVEHMARRFAE